jgi:hypothetical protein
MTSSSLSRRHQSSTSTHEAHRQFPRILCKDTFLHVGRVSRSVVGQLIQYDLSSTDMLLVLVWAKLSVSGQISKDPTRKVTEKDVG